ncbi:MAG: hypothetical protein ABSF67_14525 [Roseiarcus sp.]|jgi:hypothetical protein
MYEHRYFVEIVVLGLICLGSTSKRLAAAATAPVFGEYFVRRAGLQAAWRSPNGVNERQREPSPGAQVMR